MNEQTIIQAIQKGRTQEAIAAFQQLPLSQTQQHTLSVIEGSFHQLQAAITKGMITYEQQELERNRIHDRLLALLSADEHSASKPKKRQLIPFLLAGILGLAVVYFFVSRPDDCPTFAPQMNNNILILPFDNVGGEAAKPHILLRDRIEQLSLDNQLSTDIQVGEGQAELSIAEATTLAEQCAANVIIWGKYAKASDSLRVILQYHFLERPDWSAFGELAVIKDVTAIQTGTISKQLEDAIFSLCSLIALRQNKRDLFQRWTAKVEGEEAIDASILQALPDVLMK
ncbi:MAG: hypothetical protein AAGG68_26350 [Bacteroidota bacterium]